MKELTIAAFILFCVNPFAAGEMMLTGIVEGYGGYVVTVRSDVATSATLIARDAEGKDHEGPMVTVAGGGEETAIKVGGLAEGSSEHRLFIDSGKDRKEIVKARGAGLCFAAEKAEMEKGDDPVAVEPAETWPFRTRETMDGIFADEETAKLFMAAVPAESLAAVRNAVREASAAMKEKRKAEADARAESAKEALELRGYIENQ